MWPSRAPEGEPMKSRVLRIMLIASTVAALAAVFGAGVKWS